MSRHTLLSSAFRPRLAASDWRTGANLWSGPHPWDHETWFLRLKKTWASGATAKRVKPTCGVGRTTRCYGSNVTRCPTGLLPHVWTASWALMPLWFRHWGKGWWILVGRAIF